MFTQHILKKNLTKERKQIKTMKKDPFTAGKLYLFNI